MRWFPLAVIGLVLSAAASRAADGPAGRILYARLDGDRVQLHVMAADGKDDRVLPGQTANVCVFPAWSADGKRIAYMSSASRDANQSQVALIDADGKNPSTVNAPSQRAGIGAWSRDGQQLAFTAGDDHPNVYVGDANGNNARQINPANSAGAASFWMPDGKRIGYTRFSESERKGALVLAKADGSGEETLLECDGLPISGPNALSPDGKRLLFVILDRQNGKGSLHVLELNGKVENVLFDLEVGEGHFESLPLPAWAPDGKSFLIPMKTEKGTALFRVTEDGKTKTRLTPEGVNCMAGAEVSG